MFLLVQRLYNSNPIRERIIENFLTRKAVVEFLEYVQFQTTGACQGIFLSELLEAAIQEECRDRAQTTRDRVTTIASRYFPQIDIAIFEADISQRIDWHLTYRQQIRYLDMLERGQKAFDPNPQTVPAQIESDSSRKEEMEEPFRIVHTGHIKSTRWVSGN